MTATLPKLARKAMPVTLASVTQAEWIKFRSLPSYMITATAALALVIVLGILGAYSRLWTAEVGESVHLAPVQLLDAVQYANVVLAVLAVAFFASEYTQNTIQPSLLSAPRRTPVLLAKIIVTGTVGFGVGIIGSSVVLVAAPAIFSGTGHAFQETPADFVRAIGGTGTYLGLIAVLATGIAALIRSLVAAFLVVVVLLTVAPMILSAVPVEWTARLTLYLPSVAGAQYLTPDPTTALINPLIGLVVLAAWATAFAIAGGLSLRYRDA